MQDISSIHTGKKWKHLMKLKFFCDENITKELEKTLKKYGFQVSSVRHEKLYGLSNGDLVDFIEKQNYTFLTFDKDFLQSHFIISQGIIILDVSPNRDEFTVPLLEKFLALLKKEEINCVGKKIILNKDYFLK